MITYEMKVYGDFDKEKIFRMTIVNDDVETLSHTDFAPYANLHSLILENNKNLRSLDLRGNTSLKYLCLGTCDNLTELRLDDTQITTIDLYDLVELQRAVLDDKHYLNLQAMLSENITKQFLYIEDAILESFEQRIADADDDTKPALVAAYESYLEASE